MTGHNHDSSPPKEIEESVAEITAPTAMRKLVLNYLIHHCYVDTAKAFADDGISSSTQTMNGDEAGPSKSTNKVKTSNGKSGLSHSRSSSRHKTSAEPAGQ